MPEENALTQREARQGQKMIELKIRCLGIRICSLPPS